AAETIQPDIRPLRPAQALLSRVQSQRRADPALLPSLALNGLPYAKRGNSGMAVNHSMATSSVGGLLRPHHHYVGRFHQSGGDLAFFQTHLAHSVSGDNGGETLAGDRESYLSHQAFNFQLNNAAHKLV